MFVSGFDNDTQSTVEVLKWALSRLSSSSIFVYNNNNNNNNKFVWVIHVA